MNDEKSIWHLRKIDLFKGLECDELKQLGTIIQDRKFSRGELVTAPGKSLSSLFMIRKGKVKICLFSKSGKEHILSLLTEGDIFGDIFEPINFSKKAWVYALEPSVICSITREAFIKLISQEQLIALKVVRNLSTRLMEAETKIESLSLQNAPQRLASLLLRLGEIYGRSHDGVILLPPKLTHQEMANMTGMARQTVTLLLNQWESKGFIKRSGRSIIIPSQFEKFFKLSSI